MKKVVDVMQELNSEPNTYHKEQILRKYCEEIVDKCAQVQHETPLGHMYESILKVKKLL